MKGKGMIDTGSYNRHNKLYGKLVRELYEQYPEGIALPPEYAGFVHNNLMQLLIRLARYKFIARMLKNTDHVMEVGSGSGLGSIFLGQHCASVTGIDVKKTEVEHAKTINKRGNVRFVSGDIFKLRFNRKFDSLIALDVIEHLTEDQGFKLLKAMTHNLKDTGMLVIGTPSIYSYEYQGPLSKASHVKCYDQEELVRLVEKCCKRTLVFSMNDEMVHTGFPKLAWYYFVLGFYPKKNAA